VDERTSETEMVAGTGVAGVSWAAIFAGAVVAVATSLTLFALAAGLDLAALTHGALRTDSEGSLTIMAAVALIVTQWLSAALGGYIAGRLRTRWIAIHTHEVFFRDTAHGFITWCVATVFLASGLLASASAAVAARAQGAGAVSYMREALTVSGAGASATTDGASAPAAEAGTGESAAYEEEDPVLTAPAVPPAYGELVVPEGPGSAAATKARENYLKHRTPLTHRVPLFARTPAAADPDRRAAAALSSVLTALSMVVGAFIASVAAALGGRQRDLHP
jgi:hypothetical protein